MAHGIEQYDKMFSVRQKPWHGLGTVVENAPNLEEAIKLAGLDWEVEKKKIYCEGKEIKDRFGVCREVEPDKWLTFGIVSGKYHPIQNRDCFNFLESIVGEELEYETAGSLFNGKKNFITCKMKRTWTVGDDEIENYLLCSNSHDGKNTLKVAVTPVRVVCNNTLQEAIHVSKSIFTVKHFSNINSKINEARNVLGFATNYMERFVESGNQLIDIRLNGDHFQGILDVLFGKKEGKSKRALTIRNKNIEKFMVCMTADDLRAYNSTAWQVLNAVSDFETHYKPTTLTMKENLAGHVMDGRLGLYDKAVKYLQQNIFAA